MNITIVSETYPPEINGVSLTVQSMVNSLRNHHQVSLVRPRQSNDDGSFTDQGLKEYLMPGLPVPRYPGLRFGLPQVGKIARLTQREQTQAMYIATEGPLGWSALRAARRHSIPVLTGFHTRFDRYASYYGMGVAERSVAAYLKRFHNRSNGTLIPTQELKHDLESRGYQNVMMLPRAVDTALFSPARRCASLRAQWGLEDDDLAVVYVGRLAAEKNLALAVDAFKAIAAKNPRARFVLVGEGPQRTELQRQHPDFIFVGLKLGEDLARHYASGDLFLFPSLTETFGNVVLEALASGLPVVAYDYAAARQYLRSGHNGYLVSCNDESGFVRSAVVLSGLVRDLPDLHYNARRCVAGLDPASVAETLVGLFSGFNKALAA